MESLYALEALDDDGLLTRLGRKMAEFPLEPVLSKTLLSSVEFRCAEEVLTIVAMLSVDSVFSRPKDKQSQADSKRARFNRPEGDHMTLLAVFESWRESKYAKAWCFENFVQFRSINRALEIRKQLLGIMERYRFEVVSCGPYGIDDVRRAFVSGFFTHAAKRDHREGFKTLVEGQTVYIHPSSALFQHNPDTVIYHELVLTSREYMRNVMAVDAKWLVDLAPKFYKQADHDNLSKRRKEEKIQPLHNLKKGVHEDAWRLSRRRG
jgi:ATP-dependent RNA helicase DHX8/PRP22